MTDLARPDGELGALVTRIEAGMAGMRFLEGTGYADATKTRLDECQRLLAGKVLYELSADGPTPRVVIFVGGTNVGKSTMFNLFVGEVIAGPEETAGATKCPVILATAAQKRLVDSPRFLPGYRKEPLTEIARANLLHEQRTAFVRERAGDAPFVLVDSPDVDSRIVENAGVGMDLLFLCDDMLFVTSDQKYLDRRPLEFFKTAVELGKDVTVIFNKMEAEEKGRIISDDFLRQADVKAEDVHRLVMPYVPGLSPGDPSESLLGALRDRLAGDAGPLKKRVVAGAGRTLRRWMGEVIDTWEREKSQVTRVRSRLDEIAEERRRDFTSYARKMADEKFYELEDAVRNVLEEYRIPGVDDFMVSVRKGVGEMWRMVRRQFGSSEAPKPPIEQRREEALNEALRLIETAGRGFRQHLRNLKDEGDLFRVLYERVADLEAVDRTALGETYHRAASDRDAFTGQIQEKIEAWLAENPQKRIWLQVFRYGLRGGVGLLAAGLTGGFGAWDLLIGPAGLVGSEAMLKHVAPPNFFREFRERFVALEVAAFGEVLAAGYRDLYGARLPEAAVDESVGGLRADLDTLGKRLEKGA